MIYLSHKQYSYSTQHPKLMNIAIPSESLIGGNDIHESNLSDMSGTNVISTAQLITEVNYVSELSQGQATQTRVGKEKEQVFEHRNNAIETCLSETAVVLGPVNEATQISQGPSLQSTVSLASDIVTMAQVRESRISFSD